ncbi:CRISPR-associated endonuclease Cas2 [Weissella soli]|uniref:CRISPR-associated endonuclease Cas2 n=2 Tax=Weissella soli TaxID=155866 RepID=UPI001F304E66|nr:CRISPR-associated endonuclease Cas2 [Weissella soli]MCT8395114.1 CRISPR-associated endonuclease Cas2 [Weissella soli]GJM48402.1 hypothetical protein WSSLDB02_09590 [Weissella soli]
MSKFFNISSEERTHMADKTKSYVLIYDITETKIRTKVSKTLVGFGGIRIQKSSFEFQVRESKFMQIFIAIEEMINDDDSVIGYQIIEVNRYRQANLQFPEAMDSIMVI